MSRRDADRYIYVYETPVAISVPVEKRESIMASLGSIPRPGAIVVDHIIKIDYAEPIDRIHDWIRTLRSARDTGARAILRVRDSKSIFYSDGDYPILQWQKGEVIVPRRQISFWITNATSSRNIAMAAEAAVPVWMV